MTKQRSRGRPRGPKKVSLHVQLLPAEKADLEFLHEVLEGRPPVGGLVREAVRQYVAKKLEEPAIKGEYERKASPVLKVVVS